MLVGSYLYFDIVLFIIFLCSFIPFWVFSLLGWQVYSYKGVSSLSNENGWLEFFWTSVPTGAVGLLCFLNLQFLSYDDFDLVKKIIKVVGRQWYWSYENLGEEPYDSLMTDLISGVDKPVRVDYGVPTAFLVTSADVIHSFSVPDWGMKIDAIPGRVNQLVMIPDRLGVYVGYCTELCGAGHAYMPVVLEVVGDMSNVIASKRLC